MNKIPPKEIIETLLKYFNNNNLEKSEKIAISLKENFPTYSLSWKILALLHRKKQNFKTSLNYIKEALILFPQDYELYNIQGNTLKELKKFKEAKISFEKAIILNKNYAEAYYNLGIILEELNQNQESKKKYLKSIELNPNISQTYNNLGRLFAIESNFKEAENFFNKAISTNPNYSDPYNNLGGLFERFFKLNDAEIYYKKAIFLNPNESQGYNNLANIFFKKNLYKEAELNYKKAILLNPDFEEAYYNLGLMFFNLRKFDKAIVELKNSLKINSKNSSAYSLLIHSYQHTCDFHIQNEIRDIINEIGIDNEPIVPFHSLAWEDNPEKQYLRTLNYTKKNFKLSKLETEFKTNFTNKKIKVGYFSSDFNNFPTTLLLIKLIENYDKNKFEIVAFSYGIQINDEMNQRIKSSVNKFIDVSKLSSKEIVKIARNLEINIAIDLNGYTKNPRTDLFQYRLAPIQINYLGYPSTMGAKFFDYIIADKNLITDETRKFYTEKIIYLPNTYQPNDNTRLIDDKTSNRSEFNLPDNAFVLCCFNQNYKIGYKEFCIWMNILKKVRGSVLWLLETNIWAKQNLLKECKLQDIDPSRIIFAKKIQISEHLARHRHANLFVDTFNYNAHTTASDALWSGLPIITKKGKQFSARVCASLLCSIGLPELITENDDQYEKLITFYALNPNKLLEIKKKLSQNILKEPLFDTNNYIFNFEKALEKVFKIYLNNETVRDIWIN